MFVKLDNGVIVNSDYVAKITKSKDNMGDNVYSFHSPNGELMGAIKVGGNDHASRKVINNLIGEA